MKQKRRILFVDDEPRILKGLQRMLRKMKEWEVDFAEGGLSALKKLEENQFDVVVSDMRMPGMDGSELLGEVQKKYPMIVRIVLSGQSDQDMILKSVRPAHQYLSKPCNPETLRATIGRACALRDLLREKSLKRIVSQTERIPTLPHLHTRIIEALRNDSSIKEIGEIISSDPAMTAKILQLVNSAFFGIPGHVSGPDQAVHLLGLETIKSLVLTIEVFSEFDKMITSKTNINKIYEHSLKAGALARKIAIEEGADKETIDNSFMAGMLHDLGKLIIIANVPEIYLKAVKLSESEEISIYKAELNSIGASHAEIGAYLLGLWGLPDAIVEAVAFHHNPKGLPVDSFTSLTAVYISNIIMRQVSPENKIVENFDYEYLEKLRISDREPIWKELFQNMSEGME